MKLFIETEPEIFYMELGPDLFGFLESELENEKEILEDRFKRYGENNTKECIKIVKKIQAEMKRSERLYNVIEEGRRP